MLLSMEIWLRSLKDISCWLGKDNETMLPQLIQYNSRNVFLKNSFKLFFLISFLKYQYWSYLCNSLKFSTVVFIVCQLDSYRFILKVSCRPLALILYRAFLKKEKEAWNYSHCLIFYIIVKEKYFSGYILLTNHIIILLAALFLLLGEILGNKWLFANKALTSKILKLTFIFLINSFLLQLQKVKTKV